MRSLLLGAVIALGACSSANGEEGPNAQRSFQVGDFRQLSVEGSHEVIVRVGGQASVRAEGRERELERLRVAVRNGTLVIDSERREGGFLSFRHDRGVTLHVTVPALDGARISGSGEVRVDRVRTAAFEGHISGSGELLIGALDAQRALFDITGSGEVQAAGRAADLTVAVTGSGDAGLGGLASQRATVSVTGSGDVRLHATEAVRGSVTGVGDVTVSGGARCEIERAGAGSIHCG